MITAAFAWCIKNPKIVAAIVAAALLAGFVWYIYDEGGDAREDKIAVEVIKTEREVQHEKDRIRNNRPDRRAVIDSLRNGTF